MKEFDVKKILKANMVSDLESFSDKSDVFYDDLNSKASAHADEDVLNNLILLKLTDDLNENFEIICNWYYNWWGKREGWSMEKIRDYTRHLIGYDNYDMNFSTDYEKEDIKDNMLDEDEYEDDYDDDYDGAEEDDDEEDFISELNIPEIYMALYKEKMVGTFAFSMSDIDVRPNLYPWIINLYVDEDYRGCGISKFLIEKALDIAKSKGVKNLYLYTIHDSLYERYGFKFIELIKTYNDEEPFERLYKIKL